jgi:hypothetical protein
MRVDHRMNVSMPKEIVEAVRQVPAEDRRERKLFAKR